MPWFAITLLLAVQDPAAPQTAPEPPAPTFHEPYQAPAIRPFEPDWDFSVQGEGDAAAEDRATPAAPVSVDLYTGGYERPPTATEQAYEQGVISAEARRDALAGPLDGMWRVSEAEGRALLQVLLTDPVAGGPVVGAWRDLDGVGATPELGAFVSIERRDGGLRAVFRKQGAGSDSVLDVAPAANGALIGQLRYEGRTRQVTMRREP